MTILKMEKNKIYQIWDELASANVIGMIKKSYSPSFSNCIYCVLDKYMGNKGIAVSYSSEIIINLHQLGQLKDLQIYSANDTSLSPNKMLVILLTNDDYSEIFSVLCENLVLSISSIKEPKEIIKTVLNQLEKWRTLFDNIGRGGLPPHEQQGLYGELFFLRKLLSVFYDIPEVIKTWVGSDKALRDFQYMKSAIEVKTTSTSNHQKLHISSERQLDETFLDHLFLYHLSVEISDKNGETLNDIVKKIKSMLHENIFASNMFDAKLMEAGYFIQDSEIYNDRSYRIRKESSYKITNGFPRLKESELKNGVGDVTYTIVTDMCTDYLVPEGEIYNNIDLCRK